MASATPVIEFRNITKNYSSGKNHLLVIEGMNLTVNKGELVSVVGPSGCGKSTLLMMIADLQPIDTGELLVNGVSPREARLKRLFGIVFQDPVLFPWRTALENVLLPAEITRESSSGAPVHGDIDKAIDMIELVGLLGFENAYPHQLSGGMQSRVAIARALYHQPEILLMDEPFGDLDEMTRAKMNYELLKIKEKTGTTIFFITHSLRESILLSDKVAVLGPKPSRVVQQLDIALPHRNIGIEETPGFMDYVVKMKEALASNSWS